MGLEVAKFQYKNLLTMVPKGEGINLCPWVTLARGFKETLVKAKFSRKPARVERVNQLN